MVDLPLATLLSAAFVFLAVTLGTISIALLLEFWRERRNKLTALDKLRAIEERIAQGGPSLFRRGDAAGMQGLLLQVPQLRDLTLIIEQAGLNWSVPILLVTCVGLGLGFGLFTLILTRFWILSALATGFGAALPYMVLRRKRAKRIRLFEEQLPETIDLLGRAIRAGHPLSAGLKMVADECHEPVQGEFQRTFEEQRFGLPLEDSLMAMSDRVGLVDVRILTTAILIQRNVGGNLAEILDNLAYTIRERFKIRRQLRVYTAQGRMSGYVLALLPIVMGGVFYLLNPAYIALLFTDPAGKAALVVAIIMQIIGFFWIRNIVDIEI